MTDKNNEPAPQRYSKLYYAISEVATMTGVKAHVLRYWETEFPSLKPRKTRTGSRRYRPHDIDEVLGIKLLLYEQGFKIAGARKYLRAQKAAARRPAVTTQPQLSLPFEQMDVTAQLAFVKTELRQLQRLVAEMTLGGDDSKAEFVLKTAAAKG